MSKVFCKRMRERQLNTSFGTIKFDCQGIAEVPDEHTDKLLALNGYELVDNEPINSSVVIPNGVPNVPNAQEGLETSLLNEASDDNETIQIDDDEIMESDTITLAQLNNKNVAQLKKIAKDNEIDLAGATKKDEIIPIILGHQINTK